MAINKILVTGGAGFIGSNLALELERQNHEVTILDNFSFGNKENLKNFKGKIINTDFSENFFIEGDFDVIFHQAAITDPRYPNDNEMLEKNINGFNSVVNFAKKKNAKLIYASTAGLYGNGSVPMEEDQKKEILSVYGRSKLIMDHLASKHFKDMHIVGLRYFNVFGPGESYKGRPASMIYHLAKQMLKGEKPKIFKNGEQKRDHIYVKDVVDATIKATNAKSGIYNVGTGVATSFNELVEILNEIIGTNLEPVYFDMPYNSKTYQFNTHADITKAEKELGFKAKYSLKEGIKEYLEVLK